MEVIPSHIFEAETTDFEELIQSDAVEPSLRLELQTLSGAQHFLSGLTATRTLAEVKQCAASAVGAPAHSVKLLVGPQEIECGGQTLAEMGLASGSVPVTLVRCPASRSEWTKLFTGLVRAIEMRKEHEARRLVDLGAGLDANGNILRASHRMHFPGDRTAADAEPSNTMLHLALRQRLTGLALYLISKGADVNSCSDIGRTPLIMAIVTKQPTVVEALLAARAETSARDYLGASALTYALRSGDDQLSSQLISLGGSSAFGSAFAGLVPMVKTEDRVVSSGEFPILTSCACGLLATAVALLHLGVKPLGADQNGRTPLHYAYNLHKLGLNTRETTVLISALVELGADATIVDYFGYPAANGIQAVPTQVVAPQKCTARMSSIWQ
jgi:ankyrin repeat protein